jgi:hypothetical protein
LRSLEGRLHKDNFVQQTASTSAQGVERTTDREELKSGLSLPQKQPS